MELKVIDERTGNPFRYFSGDGSSEFDAPRYYKKLNSIEQVMKGLLPLLGLQEDGTCLEVGAGHNPKPSQALSKLELKVATLDADWEPKRHTCISHERLQELKRELGKGQVIPRIGGRNKQVDCYLGDIAFIRDEQSQLKDERFDLIYFWGSLFTDGICSSVSASMTSRRYGVAMEFNDRILKVIDSVKEGGILLAVSGKFSGHFREQPKDISYMKRRLVDLALYWATEGAKKGTLIGVVGQSKDATIERLNDFPAYLTEEHILSNPLEAITQKEDYSLFGKDDNYERLRSAAASLHDRELGKLSNIGMIDAIFVRY